jgi:hypothetical protein
MKKSSSVLFLFCVVFCVVCVVTADDVIRLLEQYGQAMVRKAPPNAFSLLTVKRTVGNSYVLQFTTETPALMITRNVTEGSLEYWRNTVKTMAWQGAFCTDELKDIMRRYRLTIVSGQLTDKLGDLCPRGHEHGTTGQSLLRISNRHCLACDREKFHERKQAKRSKKA